MELVTFLIDFILHVDKHLEVFVQNYGAWVYALLFVIIFVETGLVVMPFLPGDSLLFAAGAVAVAGFVGGTALGAMAGIGRAHGDVGGDHGFADEAAPPRLGLVTDHAGSSGAGVMGTTRAAGATRGERHHPRARED